MIIEDQLYFISLIFLVQIVAEKNEYFDAFMIQARGKDGDDGNATYVGQWVKTPKISRTLNCLNYRRSAITDIGINIIFLNDMEIRTKIFAIYFEQRK